MKKQDDSVKSNVKVDLTKGNKASKTDSLQHKRAHVFKSQFQNDEFEDDVIVRNSKQQKASTFEFNDIQHQSEEIKFLKSELERLKISEQNHFDSLAQNNQMSGTLDKLLPDFLHELSSPVVLLEYSLENLIVDYQKVIKSLTTLAFNEQTKEATLETLNYAQSLYVHNFKVSNSLETREKKKLILDALAPYKFKHTQRGADYIVIAGINRIDDQLHTIFSHAEGEKLFELMVSLISISQSFSILDSAKTRARNLISTLRNYTNKKNSTGSGIFDLKTSIDIALLMMGHSLRSRTFEFKYDTACFLNGDIQQLSHVWINLLSHAVESTDSSGHILLNVFTEQNEVLVTLKDNGKVITDENIQFLLSSNYTANSSENISKLITCKKYLDTVHAKLEVVSNQESTLFTIRFSNYASSDK